MFHAVAGDEGSGSAETCFAVNGNGSLFCFCDVYEFMDDIEGRHTPIGEVQFMMFDSIFNKIIGLVCFIVESDYGGDS